MSKPEHERQWKPAPGENVHYIPFEGCDPKMYENGVVKSVSDDDHVFVVYHCANEWHRYEEYTAARTRIDDLRPEWVNRR